MKFSSETIRSATGSKTVKQVAEEAKSNFAISAHDQSVDLIELDKRKQQSLIWNTTICSPTFATDEAVMHCRVRKSDDVPMSVNAQSDTIYLGGA